MFIYKRLFILTSVSAILSTSSVYSASYFSEDFNLSTRKALISGVDEKKILEEGKAVLTVGFKGAHAYLVFERLHIPEPLPEAPKPKIIEIRGIHLGGRDGVLECWDGEGCSSRTSVMHEANGQILAKFLRGKKDEIKDGEAKVLIVPPIYVKFRSFIIDDAPARAAYDATFGDAENIKFSLLGDMFSRYSHNCCSYVARILRDAGIDINFGPHVRSPENLQGSIVKYGEGKELAVFKPRASNEILDAIQSEGVGDVAVRAGAGDSIVGTDRVEMVKTAIRAGVDHKAICAIFSLTPEVLESIRATI